MQQFSWSKVLLHRNEKRLKSTIKLESENLRNDRIISSVNLSVFVISSYSLNESQLNVSTFRLLVFELTEFCSESFFLCSCFLY